MCVLGEGRIHALCFTRKGTGACGGLREMEKMQRNMGKFVVATLFPALVLSTIPQQLFCHEYLTPSWRDSFWKRQDSCLGITRPVPADWTRAPSPWGLRV